MKAILIAAAMVLAACGGEEDAPMNDSWCTDAISECRCHGRGTMGKITRDGREVLLVSCYKVATVPGDPERIEVDARTCFWSPAYDACYPPES
jgi:hypothetical protein